MVLEAVIDDGKLSRWIVVQNQPAPAVTPGGGISLFRNRMATPNQQTTQNKETPTLATPKPFATPAPNAATANTAPATLNATLDTLPSFSIGTTLDKAPSLSLGTTLGKAPALSIGTTIGAARPFSIGATPRKAPPQSVGTPTANLHPTDSSLATLAMPSTTAPTEQTPTRISMSPPPKAPSESAAPSLTLFTPKLTLGSVAPAVTPGTTTPAHTKKSVTFSEPIASSETIVDAYDDDDISNFEDAHQEFLRGMRSFDDMKLAFGSGLVDQSVAVDMQHADLLHRVVALVDDIGELEDMVNGADAMLEDMEISQDDNATPVVDPTAPPQQ